MSKIRKIDTTKTNPTELIPDYGPSTAGVFYDTARKGLAVNADGPSTRRLLPETWIESFVVPAGAAAADYDGCIVFPFGVEVVSVKERHQTKGTDAGAVTLMVKKVPSGTAKAAGTDVLAAGLDLKGNNDTVQSGTLHGTKANYQLAAGDALALVTTGTLTAVDGVSVSIEVKRRPDVA